MSWRNELFVGILRAEQIFYGTANGGLGTELDVTELGFLNDVTAGVVQADKAMVVDSSLDIAQVNTFGATEINVGVDDGTEGLLYLWPSTIDKGSLLIMCADNVGDDLYTLQSPAMTSAAVTMTLPDVTGYLVAGTAQITLAEADVLDGAVQGTAGASKALVADASIDIAGIRNIGNTGTIIAAGVVSSGEQDVIAGAFMAHGHLTGSTIGGKIELQNAADHDNTIDSYSVRVVEDDLLIGPNDDTDALIFNGGTGTFEFTGAAGVLMTGAVGLIVAQEITSQTGVIKCGVDDTTAGAFIAYGAGEENGGELRLHLSGGDDTTISYYELRVNADDLYFGPNTDSNALQYLGATDQWDFTTAAAVLMTGAGGLNVSQTITSLNGIIASGVDGTASGDFFAYGTTTITGGEFRAYTAEDEAVIDYFTIRVTSDDLTIGPDTDTDALMYDGANTRWEFTAGAPVNIAGGWLIAGTAVGATANELNSVDGGFGAVVNESETGGSGTVAVQMQFKDYAGVNMAVASAGIMYLATDAGGLTHKPADTSIAALTNGDMFEVDAGHHAVFYTTKADGTLGFTITAAQGSYFAIFVGADGRLIACTTELIVDA